MIKFDVTIPERNLEQLKISKETSLNIRSNNSDYIERLDRCDNFQEVFFLVKKSVKEAINRERVGLILYLMDMPLGIGAFHSIGSNGIVMNRALVKEVIRIANSRREINSFAYSILLHEYIHSLGCIDEVDTRRLTYKVSNITFGLDHIATKMAERGPWTYLKLNPMSSGQIYNGEMEIVRDFETPKYRYIC